MKLPNARTNLLVQDLNDEVLIYDQRTNKSYCLNETAKAVFNACDGEKNITDLNLPEEIIYLSLDELKKNNLIEDEYVSPFVGMNRRDVIKKVGLASMVALPLIVGLTAPKAASAASQSTFCNTPGFTCVARFTALCNGRAAGTYIYSYNNTLTSNNGTCSGTATNTASFICPSAGSSGTDLCVANNPI